MVDRWVNFGNFDWNRLSIVYYLWSGVIIDWDSLFCILCGLELYFYKSFVFDVFERNNVMIRDDINVFL